METEGIKIMKETLKVAIGSICFALLMCYSYKSKAEEWTSQDKALHFIAGAAAGATVTAATDSLTSGLAAGVIVAVAKEVYDAQHRDRHTVSAKDLIATAAGAFVGSWATGLVIRRDFVGYRVDF